MTGNPIYETHSQQFGHTPLPFVVHTDWRDAAMPDIAPNWHRNIELLLGIGGEGYVQMDSKRAAIRENDIILFNANVIHAIYSASELTYLCLVIDADFCDSIGISSDRCMFRDKICDGTLTELINGLVKISDSADEFRKPNAVIAVTTLMMYLKQHYFLRAGMNAENSVKKRHVIAALSYIHNNITKKITLADLGFAAGITPCQLSREFKQIMGYSIIEYVNIRRCHDAYRLLDHGESVSDAAYACGYENLSYFTKVFKKTHGILPSQVRAWSE